MNEHAAFELAAIYHSGQTYSTGTDFEEPYIWHVIRVAQRVGQTHPELRGVALLHDLVEDTDMTFNQLRTRAGITKVELDALKLLTRTKGQEYQGDYIETIATDETEAGKIARIVKTADLMENSIRLPQRVEGMSKRYSRALERLQVQR